MQSPARHIVGILDTNQRGLRVVINLRPNHRLDQLPRKNPIDPSRNPRHTARDRRHRRQLIQIHMTFLIANHLVAMVCPGFDGDQIPHASSRNKKGRLFPKNLRRAPFQPVDRRVFPIHIVPDDSLRHGTPHLRSRPRNRIASQIDNIIQWRYVVRITSHPTLGNSPSHRARSSSSLCTLCKKIFNSDRNTSACRPHLINSTNTSFETLNRAGASRTTSPLLSTSPAACNPSNFVPSPTPYSLSILPTSMPSNCRSPKNNSSFNAPSRVTGSTCSAGNFPAVIASTYDPASCAFAHRCPPEKE